MRFAVVLLCVAAAGCGAPCGRPAMLPYLTVESILAFPLTTPTVTACIDSYCDVVSVPSPTTLAVPLPNAHGTVQIVPTTGGTRVTLRFDEGPPPEIASDDAGPADAAVRFDAAVPPDAAIVDAAIPDAGSSPDAGPTSSDAGIGHAHAGSAVYLLIFEPSYGRNVLERAAPVPARGACGGWWISL